MYSLYHEKGEKFAALPHSPKAKGFQDPLSAYMKAGMITLIVSRVRCTARVCEVSPAWQRCFSEFDLTCASGCHG